MGQDLYQRLDIPGEVEKSLGDDEVSREPSGRLPTPPPPPARPQLARAAVEADADALRRAWLITQTPTISFLGPGPDDEWTEGSDVELAWTTTGPVTDVRIYFYGGRTRLGGRDRGSFEGFITEKAPNTGSYTWKMPWIDAISLGVRIAALDEDGEKLADNEQGVRFRPKVMADLKDEGSLIAISKSRQRLYFQQKDNIARVHIVSTAVGGFWTPTMKPGSTDRRRGRMGQVFGKSGNAWSRMYSCWMPYWMAITSSGSHGIHATSSNFYWKLGRPASHGCIRQHRSDAKILYSMVGVGTPVYIYQ
ncbi:MAG TPA: L,D-transpeptidase [Armatimonadota bacterium]|nr:L,D-transpeptidase [Armatimonadota bacterium]